jgi:hypothetical protein
MNSNTIIKGIIAFVVIDSVITNVITGTDAGSSLITAVLRIAVAAGVVYAATKFGGNK